MNLFVGKKLAGIPQRVFKFKSDIFLVDDWRPLHF